MAYGNPTTGPDEAEMPMADMPMAEPDAMPTEEYAEGAEATATIPAALTGGQTFNAGDEIVLEVVSTGEDGSLVVKYASPKGGEEADGTSWEQDFLAEMSPRSEKNQQPQ